MRDFGLPRPAALALLAGATLLVPIGVPHDAVAQEHPRMSNVIPDGGTGAIEGKIESVDPASRQVTIVPVSGNPLTLVAGSDVRLDNVEQGDTVDARYTRTVLWVVTPASTSVPPGATATVGDVAHTPGGIGPGATQISGRVLKVDNNSHSFDFVDATGGGVYTIQVTDPSRIAMLPMLKVGSGITVSLTPLTVTTMVKCGWFGCA
jgi:hypothetical protein